MPHYLSQQCLSLVVAKALAIGYAQWVGALPTPTEGPLHIITSGLTPDLLQSAAPLTLAPLTFTDQDLHQF